MRVHGLSEEPLSGRDPPLIKALMQEQRHLFGSVGTRSTHLHLLAVWTFSVTSGTRTLRTAIPLTFSLLSWLPILLPPICFSPRTCVKLMLCNKFQSPNLGGGQQQVIDRYIDVLIWNVRARQTQNRYLLFLVTWRAKTYKHNLTHFMRERHWIQLTYFTLKQPQACFDHTGSAG